MKRGFLSLERAFFRVFVCFYSLVSPVSTSGVSPVPLEARMHSSTSWRQCDSIDICVNSSNARRLLGVM